MQTRFQIAASRVLSVIVAILYIANMIYQVEYIKEDSFNVTNCNVSCIAYNFF